MFSNLPPVTKALLIANALVFLMQQFLGDPAFVSFMLWPLGSGGDPTVPGVGFGVWQLLTYGFLHGGWMHIFFNMLALFMFGAPLEYVWKQNRFLTYYLLCIVGAGLCQLAVGWWSMAHGSPAYPTVGASGGILGLVLAYGLIFPTQKVMIFPIPFFMPARIAVVLIGAFALFAGATGTMPSVAHFAHLGGMATGWLMIRYWRGQPPFGRRGPPRPRIVR